MTHSPNAGPLNARQGSGSTHSSNGFSEGRGEHHQHQNARQGSGSTQSSNGFSEGRGEHHQHQLENVFDSLWQIGAFQSAGKILVRRDCCAQAPNGSSEELGEHQQHQLDTGSPCEVLSPQLFDPEVKVLNLELFEFHKGLKF